MKLSFFAFTPLSIKDSIKNGKINVIPLPNKSSENICIAENIFCHNKLKSLPMKLVHNPFHHVAVLKAFSSLIIYLNDFFLL